MVICILLYLGLPVLEMRRLKLRSRETALRSNATSEAEKDISKRVISMFFGNNG